MNADGNRFTLARVPLAQSGDGYTLAARSGTRRAKRLAGDSHGSVLIDALRNDPHLGPFTPRPVKARGKKWKTSIASKENGVDIEGLAVWGSRVFLA